MFRCSFLHLGFYVELKVGISMAPPMPLSKLISIPTPYPQDFGGRMRISLFYQGWAITTLAIMLGVWWAATHSGSWSQRSTKLEKGLWWRHLILGEVTQSMEDTLTVSTTGIEELLICSARACILQAHAVVGLRGCCLIAPQVFAPHAHHRHFDVTVMVVFGPVAVLWKLKIYT